MSDLRDHSQPCDHPTYRYEDEAEGKGWLCERPGCPGGRSVSEDEIIRGRAVWTKGERLYDTGRVLAAIKWGDGFYATVAGDHDVYLVSIRLPVPSMQHTCTCPASVTCSHIVAALLAWAKEL